MPIFEDNLFLPFCTCAILKKGSGKEGSPIGNHGAFFSCDPHTIRKLWAKFQLYKDFFPEKIQFDRTTGESPKDSSECVSGAVSVLCLYFHYGYPL